MNRKLQSLLAVAIAATVVACGDAGLTGPCVTDSECTIPGETCITPPTGGDNQCGCDVTAASDQCTAADSATVCHPDRFACETKCSTDADCTGAGEQCDTTTGACRDPAKFKDCTTAGNECSSTQVCNTTTKACQDPCTATSCASGEICNDGTKICEPDCTAVGATCAAGKVCDTVAKVCVDSCGAGTCDPTEVCDPAIGQCVAKCAGNLDCTIAGTVCNTTNGLCQIRCDDPASTIECESTDVCSPATGLCVPKCIGSIDCAGTGGFCDQLTGLCETRLDITECNPEGVAPTNRQFVDQTTNQCTSTGELDNCAKAADRDSANAEVAAGPTLFNVTPVGGETSNTNCGGPAVRLRVEYYDPTGGMLTSAGNVRNTAPWQAVSAADVAVAVQVASDGTACDDPNKICHKTCKGEQGDDCDGISSDGNIGAFVMVLCRTSLNPETIALYLRDTSSNYGNSYCANLAAQ